MGYWIDLISAHIYIMIKYKAYAIFVTIYEYLAKLWPILTKNLLRLSVHFDNSLTVQWINLFLLQKYIMMKYKGCAIMVTIYKYLEEL